MATQVSKDSRSGFRLWLVLALGATVLGGLLCYAWRSSAPCYQGKTSAGWFRAFQKAATRHWTIPAVSPSGSGRALDLPALLREPSAAGLRALGTNAAVYLGHQFARKDGILARNYRKLYFGLPTPAKALLPKPPVPPSYSQMEIGWALQALGANAAAAAPSLIAALGAGDRFTFQNALSVLPRLEFDRHEVDPLLERWSTAGQHTNVVRVVAELRVHTAVAARCLAAALSMGDAALRRSCVDELARFQAGGGPASLTLATALKDLDEQVRYGAARALEAIGKNAAAAVPALMQATNDPSIMVQRASARALRVIQGQQGVSQ